MTPGLDAADRTAGGSALRAAFGGPEAIRRAGDTIRFEVAATPEGIAGPELRALLAGRKLQLGYRLHAGASGSRILLAGQAALEPAGDAALRGRFVLPASLFAAQPLRLLRLRLFRDEAGRAGDWGGGWGGAGAWIAVEAGQPDPFRQYFAGFNANRA